MLTNNYNYNYRSIFMKKLFMKKLFMTRLFITAFVLGLAFNASSATIEPEVQNVLDGIQNRQEGVLQKQVNKVFPATGLWSTENFALAAYWLNQDTALADQQLIDRANEYIPKVATEEQLHWHMYLWGRIYLLYSSESKYFPGRMSEAAENAVLEFMYTWLKEHVTSEVPSQPLWDYWGSENHHLQKWSSAWTAANILKNFPEYKDETLKDSITVSQLAVQMDTYFKNYLKERASKGFFAEVGSTTYAKYSLNSIYNLYDFAEDEELKNAADMFLNTFFANYSIDLNKGIRGGSQHRVYAGTAAFTSAGSLGYIPLGNGVSSQHPGYAAAVTTMWRPNELVVELSLDMMRSQDEYAYISRRPGRRPDPIPEDDNEVVSMDPEGGSLLRYTWVTPQFIMGLSMVEALPVTSWVPISSQNRRNSVLFSEDAKIFTQRPSPETGSVYNAEWGVQDKGVMIVQMLSSALGLSKTATGQSIMFDKELTHLEKDGWIFVESLEAYAAVKVVNGGGIMRDLELTDFRSGKGDLEAGEMFDLNDAHSPIIYEVNSKDKYDSFDDFQQQILSNPLKMCGGKLTYKSQAYENKLELFTDYSKPPQVNGWPINFSPKDAYVSPYLNAEFGKGIVELTNGEKKVVYDFN